MRELARREAYNETHESSTDSQAKLFRKSRRIGALLCYIGHLLADNRHGLVVNAQVTQASGTAEHSAAAKMLADATQVTCALHYGWGRQALRRGGLRGESPRQLCDATCGAETGGSTIDGRTTRWAGYAISQRKRKCVEQVFGWGKTVGRIRQVMYRGRERVEQVFPLTQAAYSEMQRDNPRLDRETKT
ncbi:hypothetical protein SAMN05421548_13121 [Paraburkholderia lycopersici]|uniref:Transposase DDE domain-containing protein n=1 Tax=Paraburkholderia lycopersici TaxID=416944 RepID=A0A1G6ZQK2_9BURK|nr:hypothetical protein SAMN05421548_13121 [Paraburkholderia lycopersici]